MLNMLFIYVFLNLNYVFLNYESVVFMNSKFLVLLVFIWYNRVFGYYDIFYYIL